MINTANSKNLSGFIDRVSVWLEKQAFFCGARGAQCFCETVIPFETRSYSDIPDAPTSSTDLSTIMNFPMRFEHIA